MPEAAARVIRRLRTARARPAYDRDEAHEGGSVLNRILKRFAAAVLVVALAVAVVLVVLRFGDGPTGIVAGGAFTSGESYAGSEPDWSFLKDRAEVEFQLVEPARSRTTWILEHEGRIYIPCGYMKSTWGRIWKQWPIEAERDGRALLRVDGRIYERRLVRVKNSPALPALMSELARKYLLDPAVPADSPVRAATIAGALAQVRDDALWIFELAPRG